MRYLCLRLQDYVSGIVGPGISPGHRDPCLWQNAIKKGSVFDFRVKILAC